MREHDTQQTMLGEPYILSVEPYHTPKNDFTSNVVCICLLICRFSSNSEGSVGFAWFLYVDWCGNHLKILYGPRFMTIFGCRQYFSLQKLQTVITQRFCRPQGPTKCIFLKHRFQTISSREMISLDEKKKRIRKEGLSYFPSLRKGWSQATSALA